MQRNDIKLSFCIPTYNRGGYIEETLSSILSQYDSNIEIVISDNNSTDNTEEIVKDLQKSYKNIVYYKWKENMGADLNYLKSVELASGEYCWFLGSDDTIVSGAVEYVLNELGEKNDIYLCSEFFCDLNMKPYKTHYLLPKHKDSQVYNLSNREELIEYFSLAQSHSALFGYLSSIIFKREKWNLITYDSSYTGTLYSHMFMLYSFISLGCRLKYIKKPLVCWRAGNDSFGGKGKIQSRYLVDIDGFAKIMDDFFSHDEKIINEFKGAFRRHHIFKNICYLRLNVEKYNDWKKIEKKLVNYLGYNPKKMLLIKSDFIKPLLFLLFQAHRVVNKLNRIFRQRRTEG